MPDIRSPWRFHQSCGNDDRNCRVEVDRLRHDELGEDVVKQVPIVAVPEIPKQDCTIDPKGRLPQQAASVVLPGRRIWQVLVEARAARDEAIVDENERVAWCDANIAAQMPCRLPARFPGADPDESRQQLVVHEGIFGTQA